MPWCVPHAWRAAKPPTAAAGRAKPPWPPAAAPAPPPAPPGGALPPGAPAPPPSPAASTPAAPKPADTLPGREIAPGVRELTFADGAIYRGGLRGTSLHGKGEYVSKSFK